MLTKFGIKLN